MNLTSFSFTDRGGREENQDSVGVQETGNTGIYIVADGLGGHAGGGTASACVCRMLLDAWGKDLPADAQRSKEWVLEELREVNRQILSIQQEQGLKMKSTVVLLLICGNQAVWGNVGDSRLYQIRDGRLRHITEDHSVAYRKYMAGEISRAQINSDEDQSRLLRELGNAERWEPDIYSDEIKPGDAFLLCSDGVWEYIHDTEVLVDSLKAKKAQQWAQLVLGRVIGRIGPENDNLSLITVMTN